MDPSILVAVGVGNTTTSAGIFVGGSLVRTTRVPSARLRDIWRIFGRASEDFRGETTAVIVGSVNPALTEAAGEIASHEFDAPVRYFRRDVPFGLDIKVDSPEAVGDDRLAHALAAYKRVRGAVIVVDMGTAVTVDAIAPDGAFLGGAILPGARIAADALARWTVLLPKINLSGTVHVPGKNTEEAMRFGVLHGLAGAIDRLVTETREVLGEDAPVLGTGGGAAQIAPLTKYVREIAPALALEGLIRAAETETTELATEGTEATENDATRT